MTFVKGGIDGFSYISLISVNLFSNQDYSCIIADHCFNKMRNKKYHGTVLKYHTVRTVLKYYTVRTVLKYYTVRTVLKIPHCQNSSKILHCQNSSKIPHCLNSSKNTTLSEQF